MMACMFYIVTGALFPLNLKSKNKQKIFKILKQHLLLNIGKNVQMAFEECLNSP
jgi:hypothetical protein